MLRASRRRPGARDGAGPELRLGAGPDLLLRACPEEQRRRPARRHGPGDRVGGQFPEPRSVIREQHLPGRGPRERSRRRGSAAGLAEAARHDRDGCEPLAARMSPETGAGIAGRVVAGHGTPCRSEFHRVAVLRAGPEQRVRAGAQAKFGASPVARPGSSARCSQRVIARPQPRMELRTMTPHETHSASLAAGRARHRRRRRPAARSGKKVSPNEPDMQMGYRRQGRPGYAVDVTR
jgi:hypothetical protein